MKKDELWILELPFIEGNEQRGTRPCLILGETKTNMILIAPLTSNLRALRFSNTIKITKSKQNNLEKDSIILMFQVQALDQKRFIKKIGNIEGDYLIQVNEMLKELFEL